MGFVVKAVVLVAVVGILASAPASAATPGAYRAQVNAICRSYTPTGKKIETALRQAEAKKDYRAYGIALGELLILNLTQEQKIEAVAVPPALRAQMTPILQRLKQIDAHTKLALLRARQGNPTGLVAELNAIGKLAKPLNAQLDKAGLRDCGSNQS
jgi:hypothetical protein